MKAATMGGSSMDTCSSRRQQQARPGQEATGNGLVKQGAGRAPRREAAVTSGPLRWPLHRGLTQAGGAGKAGCQCSPSPH